MIPGQAVNILNIGIRDDAAVLPNTRICCWDYRAHKMSGSCTDEMVSVFTLLHVYLAYAALMPGAIYYKN